MPNELLPSLSLILATISIIVSVVGWNITHKQQKEILEKQLTADIKKEKDAIYTSKVLSDLETIRNWVYTGMKIDKYYANTPSIDDKSKIIDLEKNWEMEYSTIGLLASSLDKNSKTTGLRGPNDSLDQLLFIFYSGITTDFEFRILGDKTKREIYDNEYYSSYDALERIDILMREVLGQSLPKHYLKKLREYH